MGYCSYHKHSFWLGKVFSLIDLYVRLVTQKLKPMTHGFRISRSARGIIYLEELEQASTRDFVSVNLFLSQPVWMQQFRNQTLQLLFKFWGHI